MNRNAVFYLCFLLAISSVALCEQQDFVRPLPSKEFKVKISEAQKAFGENQASGIAKMKDVVNFAKEQKDDSINLFSATYSLAILYYQINYMDSALLTFEKCRNIAERNNSHYFYYKSYIGYNRVHSFYGRYDTAIYYTEKGLQHSLAIKYKRGISNNYNQIGVLAGRL